MVELMGWLMLLFGGVGAVIFLVILPAGWVLEYGLSGLRLLIGMDPIIPVRKRWEPRRFDARALAGVGVLISCLAVSGCAS